LNEEKLTMQTFTLWKESQDKMNETFIAEMKEIKKDTQSLISLLRDEVLTSKATLNQHIKEYDENKAENKEKFDSVFKTLRSMEGIRTIGKVGKWAIVTVFGAALAALGVALVSDYQFSKKPAPTNTVQPKERSQP